jgi:hypothetical protein
MIGRSPLRSAMPTCSAHVLVGPSSSPESPRPTSHANTRSNSAPRGGKRDPPPSVADSGVGRGGGHTTQSPNRLASSRISGPGVRSSQTALNPSRFSSSSGSPWCWMMRGNMGRPSTSSTDPLSLMRGAPEPSAEVREAPVTVTPSAGRVESAETGLESLADHSRSVA